MVAEMKKDVNLLVRVEDLTTFSDNVLFESKDDVVFFSILPRRYRPLEETTEKKYRRLNSFPVLFSQYLIF